MIRCPPFTECSPVRVKEAKILWIKAPVIGKFSTSKLTNYLVEVGDEVAAGDVVVELEADKAAYEVETPVAGTVRRLFVLVGRQIDAGTALVEIEPLDAEPAE